MTAPLAVFRCDASATIGAGHVTRCLALAEALADIGWRILFVVGPETTATVPALPASGFDVLVADCTAESEPAFIKAAISGGAALLVVDHYGRAADFERACRAFAARVLVFDDATGRTHDCDLLLDAAAQSATEYDGKIPGYARVLGGPRFAMLRRSFLAHRAAALARRDGRPVGNILVSFGATDAADMTPATLDTLAGKFGGIALTVALSSRAKCLDDVQRTADARTRLVIDCNEMAPLMVEADLAIGAAGAMAYERAALGLPAIFMVAAENQRGIARLFADKGAALEIDFRSGNAFSQLGEAVSRLAADTEARTRMAHAAAALVDGRGPRRVLWQIVGSERSHAGDEVRLRAAEPEDEAWLLDLQRQPQTRRYARNPAIPSARDHADWMRRTLGDERIFLMIVEAGGKAAGMLRLDRFAQGKECGYEVSIALDAEAFGRGIATSALHLVRRVLPHVTLDAAVMKDNEASARLFARCGFIPAGESRLRSAPHV